MSDFAVSDLRRIAFMSLWGRYSISIKIKRKGEKAPFSVDKKIQRKILDSNSQYLEDVFIDSIFRAKRNGFYVDIGANDPTELSNTKRFYDYGWTGINVEPDVNLFKKLCSARPRDINLNLGIGSMPGDLIFYELSANTLSTFNRKAALENAKKHGAVIIAEKLVKVITLAELFRSTAGGRHVDFLSVDSEGYEYEIFSSNDWKTYRPTAIIAEISDHKEKNVLNLLKEQDYVLIHYNGTNGIFVDANSEVIQSYLNRK